MKHAPYMDADTYRHLYERAYEARNQMALYIQDLRDQCEEAGNPRLEGAVGFAGHAFLAGMGGGGEPARPLPDLGLQAFPLGSLGRQLQCAANQQRRNRLVRQKPPDGTPPQHDFFETCHPGQHSPKPAEVTS